MPKANGLRARVNVNRRRRIALRERLRALKAAIAAKRAAA